MLTVLVSCCFVAVTLYLWHANRAISTVPEEARKLTQKPWSSERIREAYKRAQKSPTDVRPFLFPRKDWRYIVVGGSGTFLSYLSIQINLQIQVLWGDGLCNIC